MDLNQIYGIEFDESLPFGGEKRIFDSIGMENDFVIGDRFAKNGGKNDFDSAYPFGAIRLCNVRLKNGKKTVLYEGEEGFSRDGKSGNVMVEIPKFYSLREKKGSVERWAVSGVCHPGFGIEPAFLRGGKELDAIYVGVYNSSYAGDGVFSSTDTLPDFCIPREEHSRRYREAGYDPYDLAIYLLLQRLIAIEFGTRRLKYQLGGFLFVEYYYRLNRASTIATVGKNYITKPKASRNFLYYPGMQMMFACPKPHHPEPILRELVRVEEDPENPSLIRYTYKGEDLSSYLVGENAHAGGFLQKNGFTDSLSYHTGRTDHVPPMTLAHPPKSLAAFVYRGTDSLPPRVTDEELRGMVNAFRYRGIENIWGNVWEFCSGLKVKNLQYYYTFDPDLYDSDDLSRWNRIGFAAPEQNHLGEWKPTPPIWTDMMGLDPSEPLLPLPASTASGEPGNFYDAAFYCYKDKSYNDEPVDPDILYEVAVGGGYDHYWFGSLFTYRCFLKKNTRSWLYSNRLCLRK
ncbi:MAG: hypothetical protein IKD31_01090 [Clostridia bacterium]|nr:hypothetical protein [Clostridia bacterium]